MKLILVNKYYSVRDGWMGSLAHVTSHHNAQCSLLLFVMVMVLFVVVVVVGGVLGK